MSDVPVEPHFSYYRELDDEARFNLLGHIWTTDQQIDQLLEQHGYPDDSDRITIQMGIVAVLEGINGAVSKSGSNEAPELKGELDVTWHVQLNHSALHPVPVISFYTLDKILSGPEFFKLVRLVRGGLPRGSQLSKSTILLIQNFIMTVMAGLLNEARV